MMLAVAVIAAMVALGGCKKKEEPAPPAAKTPTMEQMSKQVEQMKETAAQTAQETKETVTQAAAQIEQTICPVMGGKINKDVFVEYKGKKVYFCCPDCKAKFQADPEKYVADLPQFKQ